MEAGESQNVCVYKVFHPHHGHGGGRGCELDRFPALEALFL